MKRKWFIPAITAVLALCLFLLFEKSSERSRTPEETIRQFFSLVSQSELEKATSLLTQDSGAIPVPANAFGREIRSSLTVMKVENLSGDGSMTADVTIQSLDGLQIMSRATMMYLMQTQSDPQAFEPGSAETDTRLNQIYDTILSEPAETLPKSERLSILKLKKESGVWKLVMDDSLARALDGNMTENLEHIRQILLNNKE